MTVQGFSAKSEKFLDTDADWLSYRLLQLAHQSRKTKNQKQAPVEKLIFLE